MAEQVLRLLEDHSKSGVYQILNTVNGKRYVGSAVNFASRWSMHKHQLYRGKHHSPYLQRAWDKHGEEAFEFVVIEYTSRELAVATEQKYIDAHLCYLPDNGYNICPTAGSSRGVKQSQEARQRMALSQTGRRHTQETREKIAASRRGKPRSEETKAKLIAANTGRTASPEAKKAMSEAHKGRVFSQQHKDRIGNAHRGKQISAEQRQRLSEANTGRVHTSEARERVAIAGMGRKRSQESNDKAIATRRANRASRQEMSQSLLF